MIQVFCEIVDCSIAILTKHVTIKQVIKIEFLKMISAKTLHYQLPKKKYLNIIKWKSYSRLSFVGNNY